MARILYFAYLVDKLGRAQEDLALPESVREVRGLRTHLRARWRVGEGPERGQGTGAGEQEVFHTGDSDHRQNVVAIVSSSPG